MTTYQLILQYVYYQETIQGSLRVPSEVMDSSPPNTTYRYYTIDKLGLGNSITLYQGSNHGLDDSYIVILTLCICS
jgi:hypothetical protein